MVANLIDPRFVKALETTREDDDLEHRLVNFLHGRHVPERESVHLEVHCGTVVVSGRLCSRHSKWLCIECVRHVAGVIKLVDELEVVPPARKKTTT